MDLDFSYSRPTTGSLLKWVNIHFSKIRFDECQFYVRGLHDTYLLQSFSSKGKTIKYILRLYRTHWRSEDAIHFELDVLSFLAKKGLNVSAPILNNKAEYLMAYDAPEGERFATLFSYAEGEAPENSIDTQTVRLLGKSVAKIHLALDDFESTYSRVELNGSELIDTSIEYISKYIDKTKLIYLKDVGEKIKEKLSTLNKRNSNYGVVTGDINFRNFHINQKNQITHFDFDQCGYAHRVFEIGKFASFIAPMENKQELLEAFLQGYLEHVTLSKSELELIPIFEMASVIWVMAIAAQNESLIGSKYLENNFWEQRVGRLKDLLKTHPLC